MHVSLQGFYCSCKPEFCSHVNLTGYPLHSLVSPSLPHPCVTVCYHISTGLYFTEGPAHIEFCANLVNYTYRRIYTWEYISNPNSDRMKPDRPQRAPPPPPVPSVLSPNSILPPPSPHRAPCPGHGNIRSAFKNAIISRLFFFNGVKFEIR